MRFVILKPACPVDPRDLKIASTSALHESMPPWLEVATEKEAVAEVRRLYPDAVAMPVPVVIGSGQTFLLGIVDDPARTVDPDEQIPFVLVVQPLPQHDGDRHQLKKGPPFDRGLWKLKPIRPELGHEVDVEIRATDAEVPIFTKARIGADHHGRPTIYAAVAGVEMSLSFDDDVSIVVDHG